MKYALLAMTALAGLALAPAAGKAADCDITVGLVMELTGPAGEYGQAGAKSVEMAFRDINDAGGVMNGCKLVTDTRDSQSQGNVAVDAATQLVQVKKVQAIGASTRMYRVACHPGGWRTMQMCFAIAACRSWRATRSIGTRSSRSCQLANTRSMT